MKKLMLIGWSILSVYSVSAQSVTYASVSGGSVIRSEERVDVENKVADPAPDFIKKDKDGKKIKLSDFKGKYVLLDFWGSWCGPCRASHPHLKMLYEKYKSKGLIVIGIAEERSDDKTAWLKAIADDGLPWIQIMNNEGKAKTDVQKLFGIDAFPTKVVVDRDGSIIAKISGTSTNGARSPSSATDIVPNYVVEQTPEARLDQLFKEIFGN